MTEIIAGSGAAAYGARMAATIWKLIALVALLLMPLGMAPGAAAAPDPATAEHCGGEQDTQSHGDEAMPGGDCTAACTVVAPDPVHVAERPPVPRPLLLKRLAPMREGRAPGPAIPPPRD